MMTGDEDYQSCISFSVGYRSVLADLKPSQRGIMLKALADNTPGLATVLCLEVRNKAIRDLADLAPSTTIGGAAKWTAEEIRKYERGAWPRERDAGPADHAGHLRKLLFDILSANGGATIGDRHIVRILKKIRQMTEL